MIEPKRPLYVDAQVTLYEGDALAVLAALPAESVQTVVTSPPYWGLRDYGIDGLPWGGSFDCDHRFEFGAPTSETNYVDKRRWQHTRNGRDEEQPPEKRVGWKREKIEHGQFCECGAWLGSLGLEPTPELYVEHLTLLFAEVRRVLRKDGTLWLNLGDSYSGSWSGHSMRPKGGTQRPGKPGFQPLDDRVPARPPDVPGLKQKDLIGIPWRVAFALQADGWYLRSDIIWSKPNPMPESVTDRPTKAHEYVFLLAKSERYYYDAEAVREPNSSPEQLAHNLKYAKSYEVYDARAATTGQPGNVNNVGIHSRPARGSKRRTVRPGIDTHGGSQGNGHMEWDLAGRNRRSVWEIATAPYPDAHFATFPPNLIKPCILAGCPEGGVVLDPFVGSGTTALVAKELGRKAIGIDLNPAYLELTRKRLRQETIWGIPA